MVEITYFALIMLFGGCLSAGIVAGVVHTWSLRAKTYSLESRLSVVEGNLLREVKARAGEQRWRKPNVEELAVEQALKNPPPQRFKAPWFKNPNFAKQQAKIQHGG